MGLNLLRSDLGHAIACSPAPRLVAQTENLPDADQTLDLDPSVRDTFGVPAPRLTYDWRRLNEVARIEFLLRKLKELGRTMGATRVWGAPSGSDAGRAP